MWAVNPRRPTLGGVACVKTAGDIDGVPDAAFVAVKREPTIDIVRHLNAIGCGGAVVYASGFSETGDAATCRQQLLEAAGGMPLLGPNCYGFVNGMARAALWPDEHGVEPRDGGVAIVTQSGNIAINFTMTRRALPLAGGFRHRQSGRRGHGQDARSARPGPAHHRHRPPHRRPARTFLPSPGPPRSPATGTSPSSLSRPAVPSRAPGWRSATPPRSPGRIRSTMRCSAATASRACTRSPQFVETLKFLHHGGALEGNRIVSMSCSGGEAALIADLALGTTAAVSALRRAKRERTSPPPSMNMSPSTIRSTTTPSSGTSRTSSTATFSAVLAGGHDVAALILDIPTKPRNAARHLARHRRAMVNAAKATGARAAVIASLPECMPEDVRRDLRRCRHRADDRPRRCAHRLRGRGLHRRQLGPVARRRRRRWQRRAAAGGARPLSEYRRQAAPRGPRARRAGGHRLRRPKMRSRPPTKLGYPVTFKVSSPAIAHKTELGGVALDLTTAAEVRAAAERLARLGAAGAGRAHGDGQRSPN